jgi:hypothetical protein
MKKKGQDNYGANQTTEHNLASTSGYNSQKKQEDLRQKTQVRTSTPNTDLPSSGIPSIKLSSINGTQQNQSISSDF